MPKMFRKITKKEKVALARQLHERGLNESEIAAEIGCTDRSVRTYLREAGVAPRKRGPQKGAEYKTQMNTEEEMGFLRPGPRPAEMQFSISDEQVVMHCQSIYDCSTTVAVLKDEFINQVGLPRRYKKVYWGEVKGR